ncbi:hypothetical protein CDA09_13265 [Azoarcus sp. DN11]|nr:hypothetical protein CDA09_13265 [Azoarcus sp. DN11]
MSRMRLESAWKAAGATMLKKQSTETPDCIVVDLGMRSACTQIEQLRETFPQVDIVVFGPHFDPDAFQAAKQAGATEVAAKGSIVERVSRRFPK